MHTTLPVLSNVAYSTQSLKIVALGDSIVYGFGDPIGGGWVERLRRYYMNPGTPGHAVYNLGIRGDGVRQVARRIESEFRNRGELRNRIPDLMILSVGVNDSARLNRLSGRNYTAFETFQHELARLLDQAIGLCPVLFIGMVPVDESKMPFLDCLYYNHRDQERYRDATHLLCKERKIPYLDIFSMWMRRGEAWCREQLLEDGLHPNVYGYQALLKDVLSWEPFANQVSAIAHPNAALATTNFR